MSLPAPAAAAETSHVAAPRLQAFVFALFFIFGGITSLNDVIIPKLKELFTLSYTQAMLVQFCFFTAYAVIGIPGAWLVKKVGYMRGAVTGLLLMMAGCLLFIPASQNATYALFLAALFLLASGVVIVQVVAGVVWLFRNALPAEQHTAGGGLAGIDLLTRPRFGFGALSIFLYVGAEVSIGSLIVNYLGQAQVMALAEQDAGKLIGLYWGGAMVGRFVGSAVLRVVAPGRLLALVCAGAITLILISTKSEGTLAGYSLLAIGLMNAIMFPTIFSLACEGLGPRAADGSGIINVAIFGGAVVPLATGIIVDSSGSIATGLLLPAACYAVIAAFGWFTTRQPRAA